MEFSETYDGLVWAPVPFGEKFIAAILLGDVNNKIFSFAFFLVVVVPCILILSKSLFSPKDALYRVSQEERTKLRESVPYVKLYRYNPKHLYPKLNGYGDNGQRKVWTSCISA